ncbi:hypothetical protein KY284_023802 [Solanum tuberosum]|nr:hypothetical protein KY284_023802 [Solanum tuberosum]
MTKINGLLRAGRLLNSITLNNSLILQIMLRKKNGESTKDDHQGKVQGNVTGNHPNSKSTLNAHDPVNIGPVKTAQLYANMPHKTDKDKTKVWVPKDDNSSKERKDHDDGLKSHNIDDQSKLAYQYNFPRISNNFEKMVHKPNPPPSRIDQLTVNPSTYAQKEQVSEPAPYTVVPTYTDRLRHIKPSVRRNSFGSIWISLSDLPWHCYNKEFFSGLLSPIGKVLYLDSTSIKKTRGSQARVKVQVDLTQERPTHVWMGYIGKDITDGRWQKIDMIIFLTTISIVSIKGILKVIAL